MSRIAAPVTKLTRSLSTSPAVAKPSFILNATSNVSRTESLDARTPRKVPLMQGFRTSAPTNASINPSFFANGIDAVVLPNLAAIESSHASAFHPTYFDTIRVPLLPDNKTPPPPTVQRMPLFDELKPEQRGEMASEGDADLMASKPAVAVVANKPGQVLPASLSQEVVDLDNWTGADWVSLGFVRDIARDEAKAQEEQAGSQGMIRDLWSGMVEDVFGARAKGGSKA
ncbi:hypothetical protein NEUTE1DRAFT_75166 [Neurospora tetrasperma FGSC 2508]|uniref:Uncharacterized protein n=1 Tax=Neurospora tetrasperma (strain FGSC 2508 / ATCC MYA-4615 / P0657) TaxID=510951 RepID=F8MBG0_NEUT8|nr:uncharacterized protein NEUTE1DRAFT_75166 [Neurospora tetrasperma FGSC 2508]EGO60272.1 hypothetical protein NEUTE1DRAFT_75166 [Neurospora tetrasperma FGSC 2508]EGZ75764.1 hypothetical protein NEUTE2DRAFT_156159 [Neurospora tetrasperma FGSC 2509]